MEEIPYLGFLIAVKCIVPDMSRVAPILQFRVPQSVTQTLSFLGMLTFYRGHLLQFSKVAEPLYQLLKKDVVGRK